MRSGSLMAARVMPDAQRLFGTHRVHEMASENMRHPALQRSQSETFSAMCVQWVVHARLPVPVDMLRDRMVGG